MGFDTKLKVLGSLYVSRDGQFLLYSSFSRLKLSEIFNKNEREGY